jgi:hypothetical protein
MIHKYSYITPDVLKTLDVVDNDQFKRLFVLTNKHGLTRIQSFRAIAYWRDTRRIEYLSTQVDDEGSLAETPDIVSGEEQG